MSDKFWIWKNFVNGNPEFWIFDNPYPCHENGESMVLGEPCGYGIIKNSINGRPNVPDGHALEAVKMALKRTKVYRP